MLTKFSSKFGAPYRPHFERQRHIVLIFWYRKCVLRALKISASQLLPVGNHLKKYGVGKSAITQLVHEIRPCDCTYQEFSGSANLMVSVKLCSDDPCCHGNEKLEILPQNLPQLRLHIRQSRNFWFYGMVFGVGQFNYASRIWLGHTLVSMATKICDFQHKIAITQLVQEIRPQILAPTREFSGSANLMVSVKLCSDDPCCHGNEKLGILPENLP